MEKENFIMFNFPLQDMILVKYVCNKDVISKDEIEDAMASYLDSSVYDEDSTFEEIICDVMSSFDGVDFYMVNFDTITI